MKGRGGAAASSYVDGLKAYSAFFLAMLLFALASLAAYRIRALGILGGIAPDLASGAALRAYLRAALASDALSTALLLAALTVAWLLSPALKGLAAALSILLAAAYSLLMAVSADFLRVYQTAFTKSYIGGEQFTGIKSMLGSVAAEISTASRACLAVSLILLASASVITLRLRPGGRREAAFRAGRAAAILVASALAASTLSAAAASVAGAPAARDQGEDLGRNPLGALLLGPGRDTFMPPSAALARPAAYSSDSIEAPEAMRSIPAVRKGRYNVILYFFESTSWSYYGLEEGGESVLPAMRSLARNGLLLKNHYANYPLSANMLYSVLSSKYSMYGKSMIFHDYYDADVRTIPEILSEAGYATCLIHTGDLLYASRDKFLANRGIDKLILYKDLIKSPGYKGDVGWGADERLMIEPAVEWIKAQDSPYLLMLAPVNPHHPYAVPDDFPKLVDAGEAGIGEGERNWRNYLNSLHFADAAMGELVARLEAEGLMENTVFVMITDHGEAFYQHRGNYNHPLFIYEENVHVPAIVYSKALFPSGLETASITRHIDILPSVLDLLGIEDGVPRDGESIFSRSREKMAVVHTSWNDELMGVRDGRWKYILRVKDSREELFDLEADPLERDDLAGERPSVAERYRKVTEDAIAYMLQESRDIVRRDRP